MNCVTPRQCIVIVASAAALAAMPAAAAAEPPPPTAPGPVATPYPDPQPDPAPCTNRFCVPKPAVAEHKHIAGVKYNDFAKGGEASAATMESDSLNLNVEQVVWGKIEGAGPVYSADPMEGGQIAAHHYRPGRQKPGNITAVNVASDPEESGQVSAAREDMSAVPLTTDQPPPATGTGTTAKVTATFKTLASVCATGAHYKQVTIKARSGGYTLHDATVISVTPADPVGGQAMEEVTLSYASVGD